MILSLQPAEYQRAAEVVFRHLGSCVNGSALAKARSDELRNCQFASLLTPSSLLPEGLLGES